MAATVAPSPTGPNRRNLLPIPGHYAFREQFAGVHDAFAHVLAILHRKARQLASR